MFAFAIAIAIAVDDTFRTKLNLSLEISIFFRRFSHMEYCFYEKYGNSGLTVCKHSCATEF